MFRLFKKVLFLGQFFEIEFLLFLHVLRSPESENQVFSGWSVCVCVCYQHNSKTNNSWKTQVGILNRHNKEMLLETFCQDRTRSPYTGIHKIIQIHDGLWEEFLVSPF